MKQYLEYGLLAVTCCLPTIAMAQPEQPNLLPQATEIRDPVPAIVEPGLIQVSGQPPADAIVLFDGTHLDEWVNSRDGEAAGWVIENSELIVDKSAGNIQTRRSFRNYQLHIEWKVPEHITGSGQSRGNSGLFMAMSGRGEAGYELQILDPFENETYVNGMAGSVYKQSIPLVNPGRPPGEWQQYDVVWTAPVFDESGELVSPARVTALFNGVLVQNDFPLAGETRYIGEPEYRAHGDSPIMLQAHGDPSPPISFRNIWVRPLP